MIYSLKGVAFKFIKSNKFNIISSIFSVIISITLIISMFMFTNNAEKSLRDNFKATYGDMDLSVGVSSMYDKKMDKNLLDRISAIKDIKDISPVLVGNLRVDEKNGFDVYSVGVDNSQLTKSKYKYIKDISEDEIILNNGLCERLGVGIGQSITVSGKKFKIVETIKDISQSSNIPDMIFININSFKNIEKSNGEATYVLIKLIDSRKTIEVAKQVKLIDKNLRVDIVEEDEFMVKNLSSLKVFIVILSMLVIIMCSLFIMSNFQTILYSYRKQFALVRAIGGSSEQAFKIVFIQATFINTLGSILGILCSYLSSYSLIKLLGNKLDFNITSVQYSFKIALLIAVLCFFSIEILMIIPAFKSSRILPLKIVEENEKLDNNSVLGKPLGISGLIVSVILFVLELTKMHSSSINILFGILSAIILILSTYALFPYFVSAILNRMLPVFKVIGGSGSVVAIKNLIPHVKKNTIIIKSFSTVIIIAIFGGTFFNTLLENDEKYLRSQFAMEISITDRDGAASQLDGTFKNELDKLDGVKDTSVLSPNSTLSFKTDNKLEYASFRFANLEPLSNEGIIPKVSKDWKSVVILSKDFAKKFDFSVGDTIELKKASINAQGKNEANLNSSFDKFEVGAIVDSSCILGLGDISLDWANDKYKDTFTVFSKAVIASNNNDATLQALKDLKSQYPQIKFTTLSQALRESKQIMYQRWILFIIIIVTILASLVIGIINMLANSIISKRKEFAILRTLKLGKMGLIKVILTQVTVYILVGIVLGFILGSAISQIIRDDMSFHYLNYNLMIIIIVSLSVIILLIFVPLGISIANRNIASEIQLDEK